MSMRFRGRRGISLVELIIALAVVAICMAVLYKVFSRSYMQSVKTREDFQASRLRTYIATKVLCPTVRPAACANPADFLTLNGKDGTLIRTPTPYTKLFGFHLRVRCVDCARCTNSKKYLIEYTRRKVGDQQGVRWEDLHDGMPFHCVVP